MKWMDILKVEPITQDDIAIFLNFKEDLRKLLGDRFDEVANKGLLDIEKWLKGNWPIDITHEMLNDAWKGVWKEATSVAKELKLEKEAVSHVISNWDLWNVLHKMSDVISEL